MEIIMVMGLFSIVIFPLVMLMDKNIKSLNFIREEYETRKLIENLEVVLEKNLKIEMNNKNFSLKKMQNGNFILLNEKGEKVTKLRNIRINSEINISLEKKKIFVKNIEKEICEVFLLKIKIGDKIIKKILSV